MAIYEGHDPILSSPITDELEEAMGEQMDKLKLELTEISEPGETIVVYVVKIPQRIQQAIMRSLEIAKQGGR